jgi:hypothetical protein
MPVKTVEKTTKVIIKEKPSKKVSRPKRQSASKKQEELINILLQSHIDLQHKSDEPLMKKLEDLLDQNKTIAKGLILLEKYVRERASTNIPGFQRGGVPPPEPF